MREDDFQALQERWRNLCDQYDAVKAAAPPIVRWEWTRSIRYDPRPCYFLWNPPRGRVMRHVPIDDEQKRFSHEYGFDAQGRVAVKRLYNAAYSTETFFQYAENEVVTLEFGMYQDRYLLANIAVGVIESGRMQLHASLTVDYRYINPSQTYPAPMQLRPYSGPDIRGASMDDLWQRLSEQNDSIRWDYEEFIYQGKKLTAIHNYWGSSLVKPNKRQYVFEYDDQDHIQKITLIWAGNQKYVVYRRRKRGETLALFTKSATQQLVEEIPKVIAAARFVEPLYCLNLYYRLQKAGRYFPPELLPGFERDRRRKLRDLPPERVYAHLWWYLWDSDPNEPEHVPYKPLLITDPETLEVCERLDVEINMRPIWPLAVRTLYQISRELNRLDWSHYTPVIPDFIVYACDQTEHVDPSDSLRLSGASKQQIKNWYKQGLL